MKKILSIIIVCFSLFGMLTAQNVWKPMNCHSFFLGADSEGNLFAMAGYSGLERSQDEGETWTPVLGYYMRNVMAFSPGGRIFAFPSDHDFVCYSDDHGDTWQETANHPYYYMTDAYAVNNDTLLFWSEDHLCYTLDAGDTWNTVDASLLILGDEYHSIGDVIANEAGDVYVSKWYYSGEASGIFHSTLDDMQNWELAAFDGAVVLHMEFDPEGNVVAGSYWGGIAGPQQEPGFYLLNGNQFAVADNGVIYDLRGVSNDDDLYVRLRYSGDHGVTFCDYGEALPIQQVAPGGQGDGYLWKGNDGHLYFLGNNVYKRSVFNLKDIHYIEGEVVVSPAAFAFGNYQYGSALAIRTADNHEYPLTVDGFRPDPTMLDRLIVRYDTIPVGTVIGAFGTIKEMHDYVGDSQYVLDIQQTTAHHYDAIVAQLFADDDKVKIRLPKPPYTSYYITINGEKQDWPLVFNGVSYYDTDLLTFIGHCEIMLDPYANHFYGMELQDIQPFKDYTFELDGGWLTTDYWDPPCLSCPCEEDEDQHFLTYLIGDFTFPTPYYPMHNGLLYKDSFINNDIFREGMHVGFKGIHHLRYDITGEGVHTVELVEMDALDETTLTGTIEWAPMPHTTSIPLPGVVLALTANGVTYYIDNDDNPYDEWLIIGNDTLAVGQEITATFTSRMLIDNDLNYYYRININEAGPVHEYFPISTEWYYEIKHLTGEITYQHLEYTADTAINSKRVKIITETNTMYDKSTWTDYEYIYEEGDRIYWWNKDLEDFTLLYDFGAEVGDEWEINGGWYTITVHVDGVEEMTIQGETYRVLHVTDPNYQLFTGDIICGIGHQKSFFPGTPMAKDYEVDGLRCYWQEGELVLTMGDEDCDAVYYEIHGVEEGDDKGFVIYPNPSNGIITVETQGITSQQQEYRITNLLGQTVKLGYITADHQQIDIHDLTEGMYFITLGENTKLLLKSL